MTKPQVTEVDKLVGSRIRISRLALGLSQQDLGDAVGLSYQAVQKWEAGKAALTIGRIVQISEALKITPSSLLGEIVQPDADDEVVYATFSEGIAFISQLRRIKSTKVKRRLLGMVRAIADELEPEA